MQLSSPEKIQKKKFPSENKKYPTNTTTLDTQIDQLVYKLYDLTEEEIAIVEGSNK